MAVCIAAAAATVIVVTISTVGASAIRNAVVAGVDGMVPEWTYPLVGYVLFV